MEVQGRKVEVSWALEQTRSKPTLEELLQSLILLGEDFGRVFVAKSERELLKDGSDWMATVSLMSPRTKNVTGAAASSTEGCLSR